jgi:fucose 4-O-acetylase-like acetyltransferase
MKKRIEYIDSLKGLGIILVMLGHSISAMDQPLNRMILSFHMPLFFFSSGLLIVSDKVINDSLILFINRKIKKTIIPIIIVMALQIIGDVGEQLYKAHRISEVRILESVNWFLPTYFFMEVICYAILKFIHKDKVVLLIELLLLVFSFVCPDIPYVKQTLIACIFCLLGYLMRPHIDCYYQRFSAGGGIILLAICGALSMLNVPVGMYKNQYGNIILFYITAIIGITSVLDLSMLFAISGYVKYLGKNSLIIYCSHFFRLCFRRILNRYPATGNGNGGLWNTSR